MKQARPEHIKNIIGHILGDRGLRLAEEQSEISLAWSKAVGKKISAHTKLSSIKKDRLVVSVDSSSWLYQLNLEKEKISKRLNKLLAKKEEPLKIYFRLGEV